jgi:hypothetical protein
MEDSHGKSTASQFTKNLADEMNAACKRKAPTTNQVFNHGAEAQNYAFTQALDPRLAMFTPAGTSRMVNVFDMPKILADLQNMGYLVIYNKRYEELDPRLMDKSTIPAVAEVEALQKSGAENPFAGRGAAIIGGIGRKSITQKRFLAVLKELQEAKASPAASGKTMAQAHWKRVRTAVHHGLEPARIVRLGEELKTMLAEAADGPTFLSMDDFPPALKRLSSLAQQLLMGMQRAAVAATTGAGESDADKIWEWARNNALSLDQFHQALADLQKATIAVRAPHHKFSLESDATSGWMMIGKGACPGETLDFRRTSLPRP